jgi:hypothetical protein
MAEHEPCIGETSEWYTPPEIFKALDLTFDLDPLRSSAPTPRADGGTNTSSRGPNCSASRRGRPSSSVRMDLSGKHRDMVWCHRHG